jgi:cytochrome P450
LQNDPANFVNPEEFIPERWLDPQSFEPFNQDAFTVFSAGDRGCLGKKYPHQQILLTL